MNRFPSINFKTFDIKKINLPFCNGNFQHVDVKQAEAGTCWFLSAIASYLKPDNRLLEKQIYLQNKIRQLSKDVYIVNIANINFIVDNHIVDYYDASNYSYLWPILFEKAMLSYMSKKWCKVQGMTNTFVCNNILFVDGEYNKGSLGFELLISRKADSKLLHPIQNLPTIDKYQILKLWRSGSYMSANTNKKTFQNHPRSVKTNNLIKNHCYSILDMDEKNIKLYNPYGYFISNSRGEFNYTWEEFFISFNCIHFTI